MRRFSVLLITAGLFSIAIAVPSEGQFDATKSQVKSPVSVPMVGERPTICFAPGTSEKTVIRAYERARRAASPHSLVGGGFYKYHLAGRWSTTASGGGLSQGAPTVLTWSIVPDGTSIGGFNGEPTSNSLLRSHLTGLYGSEAAWLAVFSQVFDRWSELSGISYVYEPNDDGASFPSSGGQLGVRGDVRISGHPIDGNFGILAYNWYPNTGDMVIDTPDSYFNNTANNSLRLRNMLAHEHGHGIGLRHSCPRNSTKLMEPYLTTAFDGPQHDDVLAANRHYGDRFEHSDTSATAAYLGAVSSTSVDTLSVDDNSDTDVYSFWSDANATLDVSVIPDGTTYLAGSQNGDGSCSSGSSYDSLRIHNLELRVVDTDGSSIMAASVGGGIGQSEALSGIDLGSGAGTYYVEVMGDSTDSAQMYQLTLDITASTGLFSDGFESGSNAAWSATVP